MAPHAEFLDFARHLVLLKEHRVSEIEPFSAIRLKNVECLLSWVRQNELTSSTGCDIVNNQLAASRVLELEGLSTSHEKQLSRIISRLNDFCHVSYNSTEGQAVGLQCLNLNTFAFSNQTV